MLKTIIEKSPLHHPVLFLKNIRWRLNLPDRSPVGVAWMVLFIVFFYAAIIPWMADVDPYLTDFARSGLPPNRENLFGTDSAGHDLFIRVAAGLSISLFIALISAIFSACLGTFMGILAGMTGGWLAGRHIAFVPQSVATFLTPVSTVGAQLSETVKVLGRGHDPAELVSRVNLSVAALDLYPHQLSVGMAQRAAVAFALAGDPQVIVADEPTASLDLDLTLDLLKLLREIVDQGVAVMLITHDIAPLMDTNVADTVSVVYASRIVESEDASMILYGKARHPYTRDFLKALPRNGLHPLKGPSPVLTNLAEDYCYEQRLVLAGERS